MFLSVIPISMPPHQSRKQAIKSKKVIPFTYLQMYSMALTYMHIPYPFTFYNALEDVT